MHVGKELLFLPTVIAEIHHKISLPDFKKTMFSLGQTQAPFLKNNISVM